MNKTYKIVWSDTYQSWIACSELSPQKGKNTSTSKTGLAAPASVAAAVLAIAGIAGWSGNAQASSCRTGMPDQSTPPVGGECLVGQYNEQDNDNKKGSAIATESTPITLKSANLGDIRAANAAISSGKAKDLFTDPNIINQLNSLEEIQRNQQNNTINVLDPRSGSNQTVNVYRNIASSIAGDHVINAPTGKDIYVDLRLGTAQLGGKMIVDLGDKTQPANAAVNSTIRSPVLPAKQTRLIQADGGGSVEWISKNHIRFGQVTGSNGTIDVTLPIFKPNQLYAQHS